MTDDKVIECEALLELATEMAMSEDFINEKPYRKSCKKYGIIITGESRKNGLWVLKRVDIDTKQKEKAEKVIQERIKHIKNTPSQKGLLDNMRAIMNDGYQYNAIAQGSFNVVFNEADAQHIRCIIPKRLEKPLSEEEIIKSLA